MKQLAVDKLKLLVLLLGLTTVFLEPITIWGQDDRILESEPYDELLLNGEEEPVKLEPVEMEVRKPLADLKLKPTEDLLVRLLGQPEPPYKVKVREIKRLRLYEEMLLENARQLSAQEEFDRAINYYLLLESRYLEFPGVAQGYQQNLFSEATYWARQKKFEQAFVLLHELYDRNPKYAGLDRALDKTMGESIASRFAKQQFESARLLIGSLEKKVPGSKVAKRWSDTMEQTAQESLKQARKSLTEENYREAFFAISKAEKIWPTLPGVDQPRELILKKYPIVMVGVQQHQVTTGNPRWGDWVARRQQRLTQRLLAEPVSYSSESGTEYSSEFIGAEGASAATVKLSAGTAWETNRPLDLHDVGFSLSKRLNRLSSLAGQSDFSRFAPVMDSSGMTSALSSDRLLSLLRIPVDRWENQSGNIASLSSAMPYHSSAADSQEQSYVTNDDYFVTGPNQPREIIERRLGSVGSTIRALRRGEISVVDRINTRDVKQFKQQKDLVVQHYSAPTVCMLVVNPRSELLQNVRTRKAIAAGINRQRILSTKLYPSGDSQSHLVSGPYPEGFACNASIPLTEYSPQQYLLQLALAVGSSPTADMATQPRLTLAYPASSQGRIVCTDIRDQLKIGMGVQLRELKAKFDPGEKKDQDWDLLYVELFAMDPVADSFDLLGQGGIAGVSSAGVHALLRKLAESENDLVAQPLLHQLHAIVASEQLLIPLWSTTEFYARRLQLSGFIENPIHVYQSVEGWKIDE